MGLGGIIAAGTAIAGAVGGGFMSEHHLDMPWCIVGGITIFYHANMTTNIAVQYDERSVFGSHGQYAVWLGTAPRSFTVWTNMVAANHLEVAFNVAQILIAHEWTQDNPPGCRIMKSPIPIGGALLYLLNVRIESYDSSIEEGTMMDGVAFVGAPIQVTLSLSLKECKPI